MKQHLYRIPCMLLPAKGSSPTTGLVYESTMHRLQDDAWCVWKYMRCLGWRFGTSWFWQFAHFWFIHSITSFLWSLLKSSLKPEAAMFDSCTTGTPISIESFMLNIQVSALENWIAMRRLQTRCIRVCNVMLNIYVEVLCMKRIRIHDVRITRALHVKTDT